MRMDPELHKRIAREANELGVSNSNMIENMARYYLRMPIPGVPVKRGRERED
jgi:hypothetical protein